WTASARCGRTVRPSPRRRRPETSSRTSGRTEPPVESVSVARLFEDQREELQLEQLTVSLASQREITVSDVNRPGMALMGFLDNFLPERIQVLAQTELTYLATLSPDRVREAIDILFRFDLPCIVVCKGLDVP